MLTDTAFMRKVLNVVENIDSGTIFKTGQHTKDGHLLDDGSKIPAEMYEVYHNGQHIGNVASYIPHNAVKDKNNLRFGAMPVQKPNAPHKHIINNLKSKEQAADALKHVYDT